MVNTDKAIEEAVSSMLPYESWVQIKGETNNAYAAFCAFRDLGLVRTIRKAVEAAEKDEALWAKRYRVWLNWSGQFRWKERAADYDRHIEQMKQEELRKTIEAQGEMHRQVTGKMFGVINKKLDTMNPAELSPNTLTEWVQ